VKDIDVEENGYRLVCFPPECRHYGLGFAVSSALSVNIQRLWQISDRVAVLTLKLFEKSSGNGKGTLAVINVYAPASSRCAQSADELDKFYSALSQAYDQVQHSAVLFIAGDFNAKAGTRRAGETSMGSHGRGKRNMPGQSLVDFCECNNLYLANTTFQHSARHITTWTGWRRDSSTGKVVPVYNQIDYLVCRVSQKRLLKNCRSYAGIETTTDHRLVVADLDFNRIYGITSIAKSTGKGANVHKSNVAKLNARRLSQQCQLPAMTNHVKKHMRRSLTRSSK